MKRDKRVYQNIYLGDDAAARQLKRELSQMPRIVSARARVFLRRLADLHKQELRERGRINVRIDSHDS